MRILVEIPDGTKTRGAVSRELANPDSPIEVIGIMYDDGTVMDFDGVPVRLDIREWRPVEPGEFGPGSVPQFEEHWHRHPSGVWVGAGAHAGGENPHRHDGPHAHEGPAVSL